MAVNTVAASVYIPCVNSSTTYAVSHTLVFNLVSWGIREFFTADLNKEINICKDIFTIINKRIRDRYGITVNVYAIADDRLIVELTGENLQYGDLVVVLQPHLH